MLRIPDRVKKVTLAVSATAALALLVADVWLYMLLTNKPVLFDNYLVLVVLIALAPYSILDHMDMSWKRKVDEYLPELLRDVAEAQRTGMTLIRAFEEVVKKRYGPLTKEVRRLVVQISWGATFEKALQLFANRVGTPLTRRVASLITEATRFGGATSDIMDLTASYVRSTHLLERERSSELRIYTIIIYAAFFIFLYCVIILLTTFFYRISPMGAGFVTGMALPPEQMRRLFFHMAIIQAVMSGLAAGKMSTGRILAGTKHVCTLIVLSFIIFNWAAPPP